MNNEKMNIAIDRLVASLQKFQEEQEAIDRAAERAAEIKSMIFGVPKYDPELWIHPCGELAPWRFMTGATCGDAKDSIGIDLRGVGCALTRHDASMLRQFIQNAEKEWEKE